MCGRVSSRFLLALAASALVTACGDPLVTASYRGDPIFTVRGNVTLGLEDDSREPAAEGEGEAEPAEGEGEGRLLQAQSATSAHPAHSENLVLLRGVVRELDEQLAFVAIYRFVDEMTHAEIATQLGCSRRHVGDVLVRLEEKFAKARAVAL